MAGLLAALAALRDGRSVLAGVFLGVLTLKPQLGVMIAVVLLAVGAWRTILSAVATALAVVILPTLYYGLAYWTLLRSGLERQADWLVATVNDILLMVSPAFFFSMFGASAALAWTLHWILAACAAAAVVLIWRSDRAEFDVKAAGLLSAMLLSAPYLWYYETVLMPAIALFLVRGGVVGARPLHLLLLLPLWVGCGLQAVNVFLKLMDQRWLGATFITPVLAISLGLCLVHVFRRTPEAGHGTQPARP
jgi:arabinofuranan 3-O-arabinosyltransferase